MASRKQNKVVIVGAGAAGIGAAQYLVRHGITDVVILEAANRIGGRVWTVSFGSNAEHIVELGANWIHGGAVSNPLFTAAVERGFTEKNGWLPNLNRFQTCWFGKSDGKLVEQDLTQKIIDAFFKAERDAYLLYFKNVENVEKVSLGNYLRQELKKSAIENFAEHERGDVGCAFNALWNYLRYHTGEDLHRLSAKFYGTFQEIPGKEIMVRGGFGNLLSTFVDELPPDCVRLNKEVSAIDWSNKVTVTCKDGSVWYADHVIVTVSLGYLKKHAHNLFSPPLPQTKLDAIKRIGFGSTNKIFLEFSKPFWKSGLLGSIGIAWSDEELEENDQNPWEKSLYGFDEVYNNPNVLVGWIAGDASRQMEKVSDEEVMRTCTRLLRKFTGNPNIPCPKRVRVSRWCSDPWAFGSYSSASNESGEKEIRDLAQPLPCSKNPVLLFAGEATHDNYYSTIHGALLTGTREAQRIIDTYTSAKL